MFITRYYYAKDEIIIVYTVLCPRVLSILNLNAVTVHGWCIYVCMFAYLILMLLAQYFGMSGKPIFALQRPVR